MFGYAHPLGTDRSTRGRSVRGIAIHRTDLGMIAKLVLVCLLFTWAGSALAQTNWNTTATNGYWGEAANWSPGFPTSGVLANFTSSNVTTTFIGSSSLGSTPHTDRSALGLAFSGVGDFQVNSNDGTWILNPAGNRVYGSGTLFIYGSGISVGGGTQTINAPPRVSTSAFPITSNGTLTINNTLMMNSGLNGTVTFSGSGNTTVTNLSRRWASLSTNLHIVKNGTGTLTITGFESSAGSYDGVGAPTGTTTINGGTISINAEANLGRDPGGYYTATNDFVAGTFNPAALTLNGGTLRATASFAIDDSNRGVTLGTNGGALDVPNAAHTLTIANVITGPGSLTKTGTGTLSLTAANTYAGDTRAAAGTLNLGNAAALAGSTLDLAADDTGTITFGTPTAYTLGGLKGTRNLNMGGNTLTVGANDQSTTYAGSLSNGSLVKTGTGTLTVSGTNTHVATTVSEGTLKFLLDANLGAAGAGITLDGGTLEYGGTVSNYTVSRPITLTADSVLRGNTSYSVRFTGKISDATEAFGLTLAGGFVHLANSANDYDGTTTIAGGVLYASANGALGSTSGATVVGSSGILSVETTYSTLETLHLNGGVLRTSHGGGTTATWAGNVVLGANSTIRAKVYNGQGTLVVGGQISGNYGLNIGEGTGEAGIIKLTGASTYTGATNVNWGTLVVNGSIATSSGVTLAANTLLQGSGSVSTLSGAGLVSPGNSPGILTATSVDPAGGLDFAFEFTAAAPDYSNPTGSLNDVLRLTSASAPFAGQLGTGNEIGIYLNMTEVNPGDVFLGGFHTDLDQDFSSFLADATVNGYVALDGNGPTLFEGTGYYALADLAFPLNAVLGSVAATADFGSGPISGYVMQVTVLPEPSAFLLAALALACLLSRRRTRQIG
ncbi:MAG: autotransporter-associated beta strand repeat-containing protein [Patescibacteria group bacterium]|nr:autotransporter-associated beta strand repeat-containing protein [Patescibacteria group bacterium]